MPLEHSSSDSALRRNMHTLMGDIGKSPHVQSRKQAIAIALETQRRAAKKRADGGDVKWVNGRLRPYSGLDSQLDPYGQSASGFTPRTKTPSSWDPAVNWEGIANRDMGGGVAGDPVQRVITALQQGAGSASPGVMGMPMAGTPGSTNPMQPSSPAQTAAANPTSVASGLAPTGTNPAAMGVASVLDSASQAVPKLAIGGFDISKGQSPGAPWFEKSEARQLMHGPVISHVPGRTDNHQIKVPAGSYVLPAQHVASMGHGNTLAGMSLAAKMFGGPYGASAPHIAHGSVPRPPRMHGFDDGGVVGGGISDGLAATSSPSIVPDHGGNAERYPPVAVDVSGGEYIVPPWAIERKFGNLKNGHKVLDKWVMDTRKKEIETQKKLPPPARWMGGSVGMELLAA